MKAETVALLPPRPNPGPEPWSQPSASVSSLFSLIGLVCLALCGVAWWWLRRRTRRGHSATRIPETIEPIVTVDHTNSFVSLAQKVREALVSRFGLSWASKTTEEIAAGLEREAWLTQDDLESLLVFLREVDRVKFSESAFVVSQRTDLIARVHEFLVSGPLAEGAISRIKGK